MSSYTAFDAPLLVQYDREASQVLAADHWRVHQSFRFYLGTKSDSRWVYVPAGYLTDGASVPRALWSLIPPWGPYGQAAVVHDIVCEYLSVTVDGRPTGVTRKQCDDILLEAMTVLCVPGWQRQAIYHAVGLYRAVSGVNHPTNTAQKRALEAAWVDRPCERGYAAGRAHSPS